MTIHWHAPPPPKAIRIELRIEAPSVLTGGRGGSSGDKSISAEPDLVVSGLLVALSLLHSPLPSQLRLRIRVVSIPIVARGGEGFELSSRTRRGARRPRREGEREGGGRERERFRNGGDARSPPSPPLPLPASPAARLASNRRARGQAFRPPRVPVAAVLESLLAGGIAGVSLPAVSVPIRRRRVLVPAAGGDPGPRWAWARRCRRLRPSVMLHRGVVRSVLLVCPKPLVTNWRREFAAWAPEVPTMVIEGPQASGAWQWQLPDVPVRIANYELLLRDFPRKRGERDGRGRGRNARALPSPLSPFSLSPLPASTWWCSTNRSDQEPRRLDQRAGRCSIPQRSWALTGTPVENSTEDLLGIFEFLAPGFLSPEMKPRSIGHSIRDYVLRRDKDQVLRELPPKLIHDGDAGTLPRATRELPAGRGARHGAAVGPGQGGGDPARLRADLAVEADLQLRPGHRREPETRTAGGRPGRNRGKRAQGDRLQPVGGHAPAAGRAARSVWPAGIPRPGAAGPPRGLLGVSARTPAGTSC